MIVFRKIWRALFFWNTRFDIHPFALLPTKLDVWLDLNGLLHLSKLILCDRYSTEYIVEVIAKCRKFELSASQDIR